MHNNAPKGWEILQDQKLTRTFAFPDFAQALAFTNLVGALAEAADHHPDIYLSWGKVRIELWTHTAGGLTEKDFLLANNINSLRQTPSEPI